jgi:hypothetical protein
MDPLAQRNDTQGQQEVIDFHGSSTTYGAAGREVERIETHGAIVFLTGGDADKIKRALRYSSMNLSVPKLRRRFCQRETVLPGNSLTPSSTTNAVRRSSTRAMRSGESRRPSFRGGNRSAVGGDWIEALEASATGGSPSATSDENLNCDQAAGASGFCAALPWRPPPANYCPLVRTPTL